ncbi:MAG: hypothetical protein R2939_21600 [Kofleriaceae bacterium]
MRVWVTRSISPMASGGGAAAPAASARGDHLEAVAGLVAEELAQHRQLVLVEVDGAGLAVGRRGRLAHRPGSGRPATGSAAPTWARARQELAWIDERQALAPAIDHRGAGATAGGGQGRDLVDGVDPQRRHRAVELEHQGAVALARRRAGAILLQPGEIEHRDDGAVQVAHPGDARRRGRHVGDEAQRRDLAHPAQLRGHPHAVEREHDHVAEVGHGPSIPGPPPPWATLSSMAAPRIRLLAAVALAGCGGGGGEVADAPFSGDAGPSWTSLVERGFEVESGVFDQYRCRTVAVTEDMYIAALRPVAPAGVHHTVVTVTAPGSAVGEFDCDAGTLDLGLVYAAGVGGGELRFPPGHALRVHAGDLLRLNLHLFNATDEPLAGTGGLEVELAPAAAVTEEIEVVFVGTSQLAIPGDGEPYQASGTCTLTAPTTVLALWPYMHQLGTAQRLELSRQGGAFEVVRDQSYRFAEPYAYPLEAVTLAAGDALRTTCTYVNDTGMVVGHADDLTGEVCLTGLVRYPATGGDPLGCVE